MRFVGVRSGCPRACGQINVEDELMCNADEIVVVVDAACVVNNDENLCQILNSFVETQQAIVIMVWRVFWCMVGAACCCFVVGG